MAEAVLVLYGRERCHLCEEMYEDLQPLLRGQEVRLVEIDVDTDAELRERYGDRVPVLVGGDEELCSAQLDADTVRHWLAALDS